MATTLTEHHLLSPMLGILWDEEMQVSDVSPGHFTSGLNSSAPGLLHDSSPFFVLDLVISAEQVFSQIRKANQPASDPKR